MIAALARAAHCGEGIKQKLPCSLQSSPVKA
jgi:hypothetical protein